MKLLKSFAIIVALFTAFTSAELSDRCTRKGMPVISGGSGDEDVNCMVFDPVHEYFIIGGQTRSSDYGPATSKHGFLYAVDLDGSWKWGRYYYNTSSISDVTGCTLSSDQKEVVVLATGYKKPVYMIVDTLTGVHKEFLSVDSFGESSVAITTYGGIYLDNQNSQDRVLYSMFLLNDKQRMLKTQIDEKKEITIRQTNRRFQAATIQTVGIDWAIDFEDYVLPADVGDSTAELFQTTKIPRIIEQDASDRSAIITAGRYRGEGSVMKILKRNGSVKWYANLSQMTDVLSVSQQDGWTVGCGVNNNLERFDYTNAVTKEAWAFELTDDGEVSWFLKVVGDEGNESCSGINYSKQTGQITMTLQVQSSEFKRFKTGDAFDTLLVVLDGSGNLQKSMSVSWNQGNNLSMKQELSQNLYQIGYDYYIAGTTNGYRTKSQAVSNIAATGTDETDSFLMRLNFNDNVYNCLYQEKMSRNVNRYFTKYSKSEVSDLYSLMTKGPEMETTSVTVRKNFATYVAKYPSALHLRQQLKTPRACSYQSATLSPVEYYRGEKSKEVNIRSRTPYAYILSSILQGGSNFQIYDSRPTDAPISTFDPQTGIWSVATADTADVGEHRLTVRACDNSDRLIEFNMLVEIVQNQEPVFQGELQTSFTVDLGQSLTYNLPGLLDQEENARPTVRIAPMRGQEDLFPDFLTAYNDNRTIAFEPTDPSTEGFTFYFSVIVSEEGSDLLDYPYYCSVRVALSDRVAEEETTDDDDDYLPDIEDAVSSSKPGDSYDFQDEPEQEETEPEINYIYNISSVSYFGNVTMKFLKPVNFEFVEANFDDMFTWFFRQNNWPKYSNDTDLELMQVVAYKPEDNEVDIFVRFPNPTVFGLLTEKDDKIFANFTKDFDYSGLFDLQSGERMLQEAVDQKFMSSRIELQFDYEYSTNHNFRLYSMIFWFIMAAFLISVIVIGIVKKTGLFIFWIFVEYAQLAAVLPILSCRMIPYLYDAFKPFLVTHLIYPSGALFRQDEIVIENGKIDGYFGDNFLFYGVSRQKLLQALGFAIGGFVVLLFVNLIVFCCVKNKTGSEAWQGRMQKFLSQFKFNLYIRWFMLGYLDLVFLSATRVFDKSQSTNTELFGTIVGVLCLVTCAVIPSLLIYVVYRDFDYIGDKTDEARKKYATLLTKLDKGERSRLFNSAFYFIRRYVTGLMLIMPFDSQAIFLQYVQIIVFSAAYIIYLLTYEPYVCRWMNVYVITLELLYVFLGGSAFLFTDSTPDLMIKRVTAVAVFIFLFLIIIVNVFFFGWMLKKGVNNLKKEAANQKKDRRVKEDTSKIADVMLAQERYKHEENCGHAHVGSAEERTKRLVKRMLNNRLAEIFHKSHKARLGSEASDTGTLNTEQALNQEGSSSDVNTPSKQRSSEVSDFNTPTARGLMQKKNRN